MDMLKLFVENPTSGTVLLVSLCCVIFYCGSTYSQIRHMNENLVTKKDLTLALLGLKLELAALYLTKAEYKANGEKIISRLRNAPNE